MNTCNNDIRSRFLSGLLSDDESMAFEDHLEVCPYCRDQLQREAGSEAAWDSARELLIHQVPATAQWVAAADAATSQTQPDSEWLPACTSSVVLSVLSPTDDPEFVGRIGSYEISGLVGRGSAGIVLRGFDRALHRNVAIKILDPAIAGVAAARQRFAREARAMAAISHEHVVPVYEVSEHSGLPYFVMEYVPGGSLEQRLRAQGPFDVESVVRIGLQTAKALAAAHANGLVHRDIKPGNILLDRGTERVRVADFGLVRVSNDVSCTRSGFIAGTPQYMAPEQVKGELCDGRSDLFSLGSLMYALCAGHAPFRADSVYAVMQRIVHEDARPLRDLNPAVPVWLDQFIRKLMSKNRDDRFASADVAWQILQTELAILQEPVKDHVRAWVPRYQSTPRSYDVRRWGLAGAAVLGLFGFGLLAGVPQQPRTWFGLFHAKSNESENDQQLSLTTMTVSWDEEEILRAQLTIKQFEEDLYLPSPSISPDVWDVQISELRQIIAKISLELDDVPPSESPSSSPEPASLERE